MQTATKAKGRVCVNSLGYGQRFPHPTRRTNPCQTIRGGNIYSPWRGGVLRWKSVWRSFVACVIEAAPQKDDKLLENYVHKHTSVNKLGNRKFMFNNLMLFSLAKDSGFPLPGHSKKGRVHGPRVSDTRNAAA